MPQFPPDQDNGGIVIPAAKAAQCPACGAEVGPQHWRDPMYCPSCHVGLRSRSRYDLVLSLAALALVAGTCWAFGLRGATLFWVTIASWFPVVIVVSLINMRLFPVELEATGDTRGVWFGPPSPDVDDFDDEAPWMNPAGPEVDELDYAAKRAPRLVQLRPARTIDGVFLRIGFLIMVGFALWQAASSVAFWLFPESVVTLTGPSGFAIRAMVGPRGVMFANDAEDVWSCRVTVGYAHNGTEASTSLRVAGGESRFVSYEDFEPAIESHVVRERQRAARQRMVAGCDDGSGRGHLERLR